MSTLCARLRCRNVVALAAGALLSLSASAANATKIERVVSPGGIEAWLVHETAVPIIAIEIAFRGGANQDPPGKPGVAAMTAGMLDEGAGDLDAKTFSERLEERAVQLSFQAGRDYFRASLRTLVEHRDQAFELFRLALAAPRFDADAIERTRSQMLTRLRRETTSPNDIASRRWWETAFAGHPYGLPMNGTFESMALIGAGDLRTYARQVFARDNLTIAVVGDIDAASLGKLLDQVFGGLPARSELTAVAPATPHNLGQNLVADLDVPQTVMTFGGAGIPRKDPDFVAAYIVNHILGGGVFSSRLYHEVREQRGLAYSIHSSLVWLDHAALFMGSTATRSDRAGETLDIIEQQIKRLAQSGPTEEELAKAKSFLIGSYPLGFDTSGKIAGQLLQIQIDGLGIDYVDRRSAMIGAVTLDDVRRVAKRLLDGGLLVTVVGRRDGLAKAPGGG